MAAHFSPLNAVLERVAQLTSVLVSVSCFAVIVVTHGAHDGYSASTVHDVVELFICQNFQRLDGRAALGRIPLQQGVIDAHFCLCERNVQVVVTHSQAAQAEQKVMAAIDQLLGPHQDHRGLHSIRELADGLRVHGSDDLLPHTI